MGINATKVVVGGLAAGVVILVVDFVANGLVLAGAWEREMTALNPTLAANMKSPSVMASFIVMDLVIGITLVWLYAAIRPRFGAGPKTAVIAGLFLWVFASIMWAGFSVLGFYSWGMYATSAVVGLVMLIPAAVVGAAIYKEETPAGAAPGAGVAGGTFKASERGARV